MPREVRVTAVEQFVAPNDADGNPRRVFVGYDGDNNVIAVADEGYKGLDAAPWVRRFSDDGGSIRAQNTGVAGYNQRLGFGRTIYLGDAVVV